MTGIESRVVLLEAPERIIADGATYAIRVCGRPADDATWIGWMEFSSQDGRVTRRTDRETTQPNQDALLYWASGLEPIYFEGAFSRAR